MLGKPHWFQRRKYGGWGLYPKTWQGWAYIGAAIAIFALIQVIPLGDPQAPGTSQIRIIATFILAGILVLDTIHIMAKLPMDERDRIHEAIAERNALWAIIAVLAGGIGWQAATSAVNDINMVDPVIIVALILGLLAKAVTNLYLDRKD
jgi:hypothetical protein